MPVEIRETPIGGKLNDFLNVVDYIYRGDPHYVRPLDMEMKDRLSLKNPFFEHAEGVIFTAYRNNWCVGRITAQIDRVHLARYHDDVGSFGFFDTIDDEEVARALLDRAAGWLRARGMKRVRGPLSLSLNEEMGCLVDGFDTPPMIMMDHDPKYAAGRVEEQGYSKIKDVIAYYSGVPNFSPAVVKRLARGLAPGVVLRPVDMKRFEEEVKTLVGVYNDAWSENWGFTPLTDSETVYMAKSLKMILHPKLMWMMEIDGEPAAFIVLLPNINEAIFDLKGKLFPFGILKMLWRLKVKGVKTGRVPLMGVKRKFMQDPRGRMAPFQLIEQIIREGLKTGMREVELSWILEDNRPMRHILEATGCRPYKTYRVYEKALN